MSDRRTPPRQRRGSSDERPRYHSPLANQRGKRDRVAVIIPAYNEEKSIAPVLEAVTKSPLAGEIIVVNDGSTDQTAEVVSRFPVKLINRQENGGKGAALKTGIDATTANILAFVDADLIGFKPKHLEALINPLLEDPELQMTVAKFKRGRFLTDLSQNLPLIAPFISGQRALRRAFLKNIPDFSKSGFAADVIFTKQAKRNKVKVKEVILEEVSQVMKEEKVGYLKGWLFRLKMYKEVLRHLIFP